MSKALIWDWLVLAPQYLPTLGLNLAQPMQGGVVIALGVLAGLVASPVLAHKVEIHDSVGATLHIEPDDTPLAGTPMAVWFALTQVGGTVIPLSSCDCKLTVYADDTAIATPPLTPVSAEGYANIPGATVTFPAVGAYQLVLTGAPAGETEFAPFELQFDVTVAQQASATTAQPAASPVPQHGTAPETSDRNSTPVAPAAETLAAPTASVGWRRAALWGSAVLGIGIILSVVSSLRSRGGKL